MEKELFHNPRSPCIIINQKFSEFLSKNPEFLVVFCSETFSLPAGRGDGSGTRLVCDGSAAIAAEALTFGNLSISKIWGV